MTTWKRDHIITDMGVWKTNYDYLFRQNSLLYLAAYMNEWGHDVLKPNFGGIWNLNIDHFKQVQQAYPDLVSHSLVTIYLQHIRRLRENNLM